MNKEYYVMVDGNPVKLKGGNLAHINDNENVMLISKLGDIRNLFDESDMEAEGHGMEDMISDPYAVACYAESKIIRLMDKVDKYKKALEYYAEIGFDKATEALEDY